MTYLTPNSGFEQRQSRNALYEHWEVYKGEARKPEALVRIDKGKAIVIAGNKDRAMAFSGGKPDTLKHPSLVFQLVGHCPRGHHLCLDAIRELGLPASHAKKARKQHKQRKARTEAASRLTPDDKAKIIKLRDAGRSRKYIADRFGVSQSYVTRLSNHEPVLGYRGRDATPPEAANHGASQSPSSPCAGA